MRLWNGNISTISFQGRRHCLRCVCLPPLISTKIGVENRPRRCVFLCVTRAGLRIAAESSDSIVRSDRRRNRKIDTMVLRLFHWQRLLPAVLPRTPHQPRGGGSRGNRVSLRLLDSSRTSREPSFVVDSLNRLRGKRCKFIRKLKFRCPVYIVSAWLLGLQRDKFRMLTISITASAIRLRSNPGGWGRAS